jgi:hypothetical protein
VTVESGKILEKIRKMAVKGRDVALMARFALFEIKRPQILNKNRLV